MQDPNPQTTEAQTNEAFNLALQLTRFASVTESAGERAFAPFLHKLMLDEPYFANNPNHVWLQKIANDPHGRSNVFAFVPGQGNGLVVLTGHFDVVSVENYGLHQSLAFEPEQLRAKLIEDLQNKERNQQEELALTDLLGPNFLPGRGLLDMKAGLAAGLVTLYRFARTENRVGNILFVAVADEENYSFGARAAAPEVLQFSHKQNLKINAVINLDATSDQGDGRDGQAVYLGSVGKSLLGVFVAAKEIHAGYSLDGLNPSFLLGEIARRLEWSVQLTDKAFGEIAAPPTSLSQRDLKNHYDVTTPATAWACFNVLSLQKTPAQILEETKQEATMGANEALKLLRERAESLGFNNSAAHTIEAHSADVLVLSFAELLERARANQGANFENAYQTFLDSLDTQLDLPNQSAKIVAWLWEQSGLSGPAAVLCFASLYYPPVCLNEQTEAVFLERLRKCLQEARQDLPVHILEKRFFRGISDMSWFGRSAAQDLDVINQNSPTRTAQLQATSANLPTINLGPWGRDYHQYLERVHLPYSFDFLPELLWRLSQEFLS